MNNPNTGEKVEGTEIQYGACKYCGQTYQLETSGMATQEQLDQWATEKCDCPPAKVHANRKERIKRAQQSICELFPEGREAVRETLNNVIGPIYEGVLDKVTIKSGNMTSCIYLNGDGEIVIERTDTRKAKKISG